MKTFEKWMLPPTTATKVIIKGNKSGIFFPFVKWHRNIWCLHWTVFVCGHFFCSVALLKFHLFWCIIFISLLLTSFSNFVLDSTTTKKPFLQMCVSVSVMNLWLWMDVIRFFVHQFLSSVFLEWEMSFSLIWMAKFSPLYRKWASFV